MQSEVISWAGLGWAGDDRGDEGIGIYWAGTGRI